MIAIFSDTHSPHSHELEGEALTVARDADVVVHAGDFTSVAALEAFQDEVDTLFAVHGNADSGAVRGLLPTERVVEAEGVRIALTHRPEGGETGLAMLGRSNAADLVVFGHTHRPTVVENGNLHLLNPGSHAQPRGHRPGFAVLEPTPEGVSGRLLEPDGTLIEAFEFER